MEQTTNRNMVPVGPGGTLGRIGRMIVMVCTGGFAYPNVFVEGMDCTAIQKETEGSLYEKKKGKKSLPGDFEEGEKGWRTQQASASVAK
jgi:hypothetical protein